MTANSNPSHQVSGIGLELTINHVTEDSTHDAEKLIVDGNYLYALTGLSTVTGLAVYDISDAADITYLAHYSFAYTTDIVIENGIGYISLVDEILIYNFSNPNNIDLLGFHSTSDTNDLAIHQDVLYVADGTNGLLVLNITNFGNITEIDNIHYTGSVDAVGVEYYSEYVYVLDANYGGYTFDAEFSDSLTSVQYLSNIYSDLFIKDKYGYFVNDFFIDV